MNDERLKCILLGLNTYELTLRERQFVEAVKKHFNGNRMLTDQQDSILEGIYREKRRIGKTVFQQPNQYQIPSRNNRHL
jgi:hypothetical protein